MWREGVHTLGPLADWKRLHTVEACSRHREASVVSVDTGHAVFWGQCRVLRVLTGKEQLVNGDCSCLPRFPLWSHYVMCFWAVEDLFLSSWKLSYVDSSQDADYRAQSAVFSCGWECSVTCVELKSVLLAGLPHCPESLGNSSLG